MGRHTVNIIPETPATWETHGQHNTGDPCDMGRHTGQHNTGDPCDMGRHTGQHNTGDPCDMGRCNEDIRMPLNQIPENPASAAVRITVSTTVVS